ncbi:MAG: nitroreductase family protein [Candidatus Zixiibacteriota bacterium]
MTDYDNCKHHGAADAAGGEFPNETMKLLIERGSCRSFLDKKIPQDVMDLVLRAGIHAATGGNLQPFSIIKIEDKRTGEKLGEMCQQKFIGEAPMNLIFCLDWHRLERWAKLAKAPFSAKSAFRHFWIGFQDVIIAAQNICTAADAMGLGSVYIGTIMDFPGDIRRMFELPDGVFPVVLLCIGYPKVRPAPRKKLAVDVIVHNEKYQEPADQMLLEAFENKYPDRKFEITDERMECMEDVCRTVHGNDFAKACLDSIRKCGHINMAQYYFGLHYMANIMPQGNEEFVKMTEEAGFGWFKEFTPPIE